MRGITAEQVAALHCDGGRALAEHYPISEFEWPTSVDATT